jgi:3-oxoacyl-[acyl-carrier protein] reductase
VNLKGAVAIVTGGGTGIGRAVCLDLARAGAHAVVVNYSRSQEEAEQTAGEVSTLGAQGLARRADISRDSECKEMVEATLERFGRLDVLVNNGATTHLIPPRDLDAVTEQVWDEILGVNVKGTFNCSRATAPALRRSQGAIVNIASMGGIRAVGSSIPYGVSKAAVIQMTRNLAMALAPEVRVNSVSPGAVATRWFRTRLGEEAASGQEQRMAAITPLARVATPEHVSQAVLGLLGMDQVTGENVIVDGGAHIMYGPPAPARD